MNALIPAADWTLADLLSKGRLSQETIAMRAAREIPDGAYVNLGGGIPTLCAAFLPEDVDVFLQAEQGILGYGPLLREGEMSEADFDYIDASQHFFRPSPGLAFMDMAASFDMIRGGHLDLTFLGALEVSERGDMANWTLTGDPFGGGIGGAMDLASSVERVVVCMTHITRDGRPKLLRECRLPLTARACVNLVVTDLAVIEVTSEGLVLREIAPGWSVAQVQALTEPTLLVSPDLKEIAV